MMNQHWVVCRNKTAKIGSFNYILDILNNHVIIDEETKLIGLEIHLNVVSLK